MIGTSLLELLFIRACIFLLRYSIHIYVILLILSQLLTWTTHGPEPGPWPTITAALSGLLVAELLFLVGIYLPFTRRSQREAKHPPAASTEERWAILQKCLANVPDPDAYISKWFLGADPATIRREDLRKFILWAFFDRDDTSDDNDDEALEMEVDRYVDQIEDRCRRRFPEGGGSARSLRLTLDPVEVRYRSVLWYAIVALVDMWTHAVMLVTGFRYRSTPWKQRLFMFPPRPQLFMPSGWGHQASPSKALSYWIRPHTAAHGTPVVFLHGIGIGLIPYIKFFSDINRGRARSEGEIGVIAVELLPISFRITSDPLGREDFLTNLSDILSHHGWDSFVLVSHSYGSALSTHVIRSPQLGAKVESVVLIDPVSLLLHLPEVAYNFTRRVPRHANEWQLWFLASMDPGVAHTLGRHFFWRDNEIWKEELWQRATTSDPVASRLQREDREGQNDRRRQVAVCLAGRDLIVDTQVVEQYLRSRGDLSAGGNYENYPEAIQDGEVAANSDGADNNEEERREDCLRLASGIELIRCPQLDHAQIFDSPKDLKRLVAVVQRYSGRRRTD